MRKLTIPGLGFVLLMVLLASCEKKEDTYSAFLISVDSIQLPGKVIANITFDIRCYGTVGTNGCYSFTNFTTTTLNNVITVETWGKFRKNSPACPDAMVYLDGEILSLKLETAGNYILRMKRKDGGYLERQMVVE